MMAQVSLSEGRPPKAILCCWLESFAHGPGLNQLPVGREMFIFNHEDYEHICGDHHLYNSMVEHSSVRLSPG